MPTETEPAPASDSSPPRLVWNGENITRHVLNLDYACAQGGPDAAVASPGRLGSITCAANHGSQTHHLAVCDNQMPWDVEAVGKLVDRLVALGPPRAFPRAHENQELASTS